MAKIGEGHLSAVGRQGLREIRAAMYPDSNIAQQPEYGLYGTKTPGEVAEERRNDDRDPEQETKDRSIIDERLERAKDRGNREDDSRGRDMEE